MPDLPRTKPVEGGEVKNGRVGIRKYDQIDKGWVCVVMRV